MTSLIHRFRGILIALTALALSAGLAFGAQPTSTGLANAALHTGKTVPVQARDEETAGDEDTTETTDEETAETDDSSDSGDNCTDPTTLTADQLAATRHGSIVCWAAQQTTWPEWFSNHGAFVKCWAHQGKADATDCTQAPTAGQPAAPTTHGPSAGHGHGRGHNK